ncbi:MAG TPA: DUF485 domain-containing protein [Hellea balneolensis]|uniref:DUF485 domain-containing protein n=1 Tax=Hellea balneolensis TaxID=287478 RepID=A0A7C3C170_9PROT|nr:DUF485 domain-containing protein [Hellea balneolensis]
MMDLHNAYQMESFQKLMRTRARVIWPLSVFLVIGLIGNLYLMSSGAELGAQTISEGGVLTVALVYSLVLIFLGASVAIFYVWWANTYLDPMMEHLRREIDSVHEDAKNQNGDGA